MTRASMLSVVVFMALDVVDCFIRSSYPTPLDRFLLVEALRDCLKTGENRVGADFSVGQEGGRAAIPVRSCPVRSDTGQREKPPNPSGKSKGRCLAAFPARSKPAAGILPRRCLTIQTPLALARHSPVFRQSLKGSARASLNEPLQGRGREGNTAVESVSREDEGPAPVSPAGVSNRTEAQWRRV